MCQEGVINLSVFIDAHSEWVLKQNSKWGGLTFYVPQLSDDVKDCGGKWTIILIYIYQGPSTDPEFKQNLDILNKVLLPKN